MARQLLQDDVDHDQEALEVGFVKGVVEARDPCVATGVEELRAKVLADFAGTVFVSKVPIIQHPIRGPFGEAEINLKARAKPVKQRMFHITG